VIGLAAAEAVKSTSAWDQPGTLGFLVVFGMAVILYFVFRSLARQLRKVNEAARAEAAQAESAEGKSATDNQLNGNGVSAR
jgi:phosphotransferase system  glucose/maltose/N-acetylglucosamine-specific IIC component